MQILLKVRPSANYYLSYRLISHVSTTLQAHVIGLMYKATVENYISVDSRRIEQLLNVKSEFKWPIFESLNHVRPITDALTLRFLLFVIHRGFKLYIFRK